MQNAAFTVAPHVLEQAYKAIRTTPPEPKDLEQSDKLQQYMDKHFPTETPENITRRSMILAELRATFREWVKQVCLAKGVPEDIAADAGGQILVSGSYRLGVNEPGADIDTICVAPRHVTREDFFTSLKDIFLKNPKVSNLVAIEGAIVPILTFDYEEINIDLQIAILPRNTIPDNLNILDDNILAGVDTATEKSLNGPRVTELMIKLTPNRDSFISVLRIVRRWAKRRGIYSNKMGYLGGVNWCILVCFINQLYPTAAPSTLLLRFFMVLSNWKWPLAIQLCKTYDAKLGLEVWNANYGNNRYQTMPILTPAYPSMNSSFNVSTHSLAVMKEEFKRGLEIVQDILNKGGDNWDALFEPSDFFGVQQHYLAVDVFTTKEEEEQAWCGFCESRVRKLVDSLAFIPQLCHIRAFPKKFPLSFVDTGAAAPDGNDSAGATKRYGACFFVGFDIDRRKLMGKELNIDNSVYYFIHNDLYRWNKKTPTMDVKISPTVWKNLPECVFEDMGGRATARNVRKEHMRKKKEEEAAAESTATSASQSDDSQKDVASQETDSVSHDAATSGSAESTSPQSPNPATESDAPLDTQRDRSSSVSSVENTAAGGHKRDRENSIEEEAKRVASLANATMTSPTTTPVKPAKEPEKPLHRAIGAPAAASPRKRRKMKITFGKLG
ncbi:hypothetical protein PINS_up003727 [Pythium insidiosum]|nr:hypothetical protein PINS_up003727 [Pythium insidiosum]